MEIMNNIATNNTNNNNDAFAFLDQLMNQTEHELAGLADIRENAQKKREEIMKNDTVFAAVVASRGYIGIINMSMDNKVANAPAIKPAVIKGKKLTSPTTTLIGVHSVIGSALQGKFGDKKHLTIYANTFEIPRLSGMLRRINDGLTAETNFMTEKEMEYVEKNVHKYGELYASYAKALFKTMAKAVAEGFKLRFVGFNTLSGYALKYRYPIELAGKVAEFKNGFATVTDSKGIAKCIATANNFKLNGKHKLIKNDDGVLVVERPIKEGSEQAFVSQMFAVTARSIMITATKAAAEAGVEEEAPEEIA